MFQNIFLFWMHITIRDAPYPEASPKVPDFTISVLGSSCNCIFSASFSVLGSSCNCLFSVSFSVLGSSCNGLFSASFSLCITIFFTDIPEAGCGSRKIYRERKEERITCTWAAVNRNRLASGLLYPVSSIENRLASSLLYSVSCIENRLASGLLYPHYPVSHKENPLTYV